MYDTTSTANYFSSLSGVYNIYIQIVFDDNNKKRCSTTEETETLMEFTR
ncbi:hypothetical protein NARC_10307 [Candidatus Nitrosocosmicus arcticus]|uniref:Uncharacterized protein n=1 Tax=Candidatus Nitrosocosmicus arcticus TaxID=2035267 RepID=A0A557SZ70_9ARCH|nr:hypothetical protein NARC_10307 [Candidatus Nitrosocosmicus arcticus]